MSSSPWDIYRDGLEPLGYGYPLWNPEPSDGFGEVQLCDVGYIQRGRFCFLFNAAEKEGNRRVPDVPDGFKPFSYVNDDVLTVTPSIMQHTIHSMGIEPPSTTTERTSTFTSDQEYTCNAPTGALVLVGYGRSETTTLRRSKDIREYVLKHVSTWRDFARNKLGIDVEEKDLIFVSGYTKTSEWGIVAFRDADQGSRLIIQARGNTPAAASDEQWLVRMENAPKALLFARAGPVNRIQPQPVAQSEAPTGAQGGETAKSTSEGLTEAKTAEAMNPKATETKAGETQAAETRVTEKAGEASMDQCIFLQYYRVKNRLLRTLTVTGSK